MKTGWDAARLYHLHSSYVRERRSYDVVDVSDAHDDDRPSDFRTYPGSARVALPGRDFRLAPSLGTVLRRRRSVRDFRLRPLDLTRVGRLLHAAYGTEAREREPGYHRPCPSAGGFYPLELYAATQSVAGLPDAVYHYDARAHELELRRAGLAHGDLAALVIREEFRDIARTANLVIVISAIFARTMHKYGERGYRYVWLEAGHVGQNLYLAATALGLGPVSLDGFLDHEVSRFLGLPADEEDAIYLVCIGRPRGRGPVRPLR